MAYADLGDRNAATTDPLSSEGPSRTLATVTVPATTAGDPVVDTFSVTTPGSGLVFNNTFMGAATDANFQADALAAESYLASQFKSNDTVNVTFTVASINPAFSAENYFPSTTVTYANYVNALKNEATSAVGLRAVAALQRLADPSNGAGFSIPVSYARMLGLGGQNNGADDSLTLNSVYFTTSTFQSDPGDTEAVIEHELSEGSMGRIGSLGKTGDTNWAPMDLFRFNAQGGRDFTGGSDGVPTFFSPDGTDVNTGLQFHNSINAQGQPDGFDLADWDGVGADANNMDPFGPGGPGVGDPGTLSATDIAIMQALGWNSAAAPPPPSDTTPPSLLNDSSLSLTAGTTATITSSLLRFDDPDNGHAQETYTVISGPADGQLLKSASPATSFTQADIDNGLVTYRETVTGAKSDSFTFKVSDAAGNSTTSQTFSFNISPPADTTPPSLVNESSLSLAAGTTETITSGLLRFDDDVSTHAQETYTVINGPADGQLLRSGSIAASFTQADIDNGLVTYHETATGAKSDSFIFKVSDAAGNSTTSQTFSFTISSLPSLPSADLLGDGKSDLLMQNGSNALFADEVSGGQISFNNFGSFDPAQTQFEGFGDFLHLGESGYLLWNSTTGEVDAVEGSVQQKISSVSSGFQFEGTGDFLGQGRDGFLLSNSSTGETDFVESGNQQPVAFISSQYEFKATGDFLGDGETGFLLWNSNDLSLDVVEGGNQTSLATILGSQWQFEGTGDLLGNGKDDFVIFDRSGSGEVDVGEVSGTHVNYTKIATLGSQWQFLGIGNYDGKSDGEIMLFEQTSGDFYLGSVVGGRLSDVKVGSETSPFTFYTGNVDNPTVTSAQLPNAPTAASADPTIIVATGGDQTLSAAAGSTVFDFSDLSFGHTTIAGFDPAQDAISLNSSLVGSTAALQSDISAVGAGTLITLDPKHSILLSDVAPTSLGAANFRLV